MRKCVLCNKKKDVNKHSVCLQCFKEKFVGMKKTLDKRAANMVSYNRRVASMDETNDTCNCPDNRCYCGC